MAQGSAGAAGLVSEAGAAGAATPSGVAGVAHTIWAVSGRL